MTIVEFLKAQKTHAGNYLSLAVGLGVANGLLLIVQAWILAKIVSSVLFSNHGLADNKGWLALLLLLFLCRAVLAWFSEQAAFRAAIQVKLQMRDKLYQHLLDLGPVYFRGERSGEIVNTLVDGVEELESYYARYLPAIALMALVPFSILVFIFPVDWVSALIMLVTAPLIPLFMILIGKGAEKLNQKQWRKMARMSAHFLDVIQGLTTLKLFNVSRREASTVARISDEYRRDTMAVLRIAFLSSLTLEFFATISIAIVAVLIGFRLLWGEMDFQYGFFVLLLAPEFYLPLRNMGTNYHARMSAVAAAEKMLELTEIKSQEVPATTDNLLLASAPEIVFKNVSFRYDDDRIGLDGASASFRSGDTVAVVGSSGSGKTTLINMLLGFSRPQYGEILINSTPLRKIRLREWRKNIAWVPQQPRIFEGSLRDNLCMGIERTDKEIYPLLQQARVDEFLARFPEGLDTQLNESGRGLSGGQIQRIALARAFLKNASVVILDEATANLDRHNEQLVLDAIRRLADGRTLIMIAHRLETIRQADRILVLDKGRVAEAGNHEELLARQGIYHRLLSAST